MKGGGGDRNRGSPGSPLPRCLPLAKTSPPVAPTTAVHLPRPALTDRLLAAIARRLTVITGSAGTGKTTLLTQLLPRLERDHYWINLDADDADLPGFAGLLLAAVQRRYPETGQALTRFLARLPQAHGALPGLARLALDMLDQIPPAVFILDDVHLVSAQPEIAAFLERVIELLPAGHHFILASRHILELKGISRWRARQWIFELDQGELLLSPADLEALLARWQVAGNPASLGVDLHRISGGWVGLVVLLVARLRQTGATAAGFDSAGLEDDAPQLLEFIAQEVISGFSDEVRELVLETSLFDRVEPAEVQAVLERGDVEEVFERVLCRFGFATRFAGQPVLYRYHETIRRTALKLLARRAGPAGLSRRHVRLAEQLETAGEVLRALGHWLQAGDWRRAALAAEKALDRYRWGSERFRIGGLIMEIPEASLDEFPRLLLFQARERFRRSEVNETLRLNDRALHGLRRAGSQRGVLACHRQRVEVLRLAAGPGELRAALEEALADSGGCANEDRVVLEAMQVYLHGGAGKWVELQRILDRGLETARAGSEVVAAADLQLTAAELILLSQGRFTRCIELAALQIPVFERHGYLEALIDGRYVIALARQRLGDLEGAVASLEPAQETSRQYGMDLNLVRVSGLLSELHSERRQFRCAREYLDELDGLRATGIQAGFPTYYDSVRATAQAAFHLHREDFGPALEALERLPPGALGAVGLLPVLAARRLRTKALAGLGRFAEARSLLETELSGYLEERAEYPALACELELARLPSAGEPRAALEHLARALGRMRRHDLAAAGVRDEADLPVLIAALAEDIEPDYVTNLLAQSRWRTQLESLRADGRPRVRRAVSRALELADMASGAPSSSKRRLPNEPPGGSPEPAAGAEPSSAAPLQIRCFGAFEVRIGTAAEPIGDRAWRVRRARDLVKYLVLHRNQPTHQERLIDLLWPDDDLESGAAKLHNALSYLRRALEPDLPRYGHSAYLRRSDRNYLLVLPPGSFVDFEAFEGHLSKVEGALAAGRPIEAAAAFGQAAGLFRGELLAENPYDEWFEGPRRRLAERFQRAGTSLARRLLEGGQPERAITAAAELAAREPLAEDTIELLMKAYLAIGQHSLAASTFESYRRRLRAELDCEPDPYLDALHRNAACAPMADRRRPRPGRV